MFVYDDKENKWIRIHPEDLESFTKRFQETREESAFIKNALEEIDHKRVLLEQISDPFLYAADIIDALLALSKLNTTKRFPSPFFNTVNEVLSQDKIKGTIFSAFLEIECEALDPLTLDNIIRHIPNEVKMSLWAGEEDDTESDTELYIDTDDEDPDTTTETEMDECVSVNILSAKEAFFEVLNSIQTHDSLKALNERRNELDKALKIISRQVISNQVLAEQMLKQIEGPAEVTELLLICDPNLDKDLQAVMQYRLNKNPALLVMDLKEYVSVINYLQSIGLSDTFSRITKLGILHHSGNILLDSAADNYVPYIKGIGDSLPNVSTVVLRGCGMVQEKPAKKLALNKARATDPTLASDAAAKTSIRKGMLFFKANDERHEHGKSMREFTLDVGAEEGKKAVIALTNAVVCELKKSNLGKDLSEGVTPTIKCYVAGYVGDPVKGAKPDLGVALDDRFLTAPKAIRFEI